jgi:hypothetical protein
MEQNYRIKLYIIADSAWQQLPERVLFSHFYLAAGQGMIGTADTEFFGEPSINLSL